MDYLEKTSVSRRKIDRPFWQELEEMLQSEVFIDATHGHLSGSMSGESWKAFLKTVRDEVLQKLDDYRAESFGSAGFCASSLGPFREEKMKLERAYLRNLVDLYKSAEKAYRSLSG
jgi:hypothetical protein